MLCKAVPAADCLVHGRPCSVFSSHVLLWFIRSTGTGHYVWVKVPSISLASHSSLTRAPWNGPDIIPHHQTGSDRCREKSDRSKSALGCRPRWPEDNPCLLLDHIFITALASTPWSRTELELYIRQTTSFIKFDLKTDSPLGTSAKILLCYSQDIFFSCYCLIIHICHLFLKNFYRSTVDLQCCVSFRCTAKWISYTYTSIHSFF